MDNNNLFTSMFGVESEEPKTPEVPEKPQPEINNQQSTFQNISFEQNFNNQTFNQNPIEQYFNPQSMMQQNSFTQPINNQPQQEEIIYLDSNTKIAEETPKQNPEVQQPLFDTSGMYEQKNNSIPDFESTEKPSPALIIFLIVALLGGGLFMLVTTFIDTRPTNNKTNEEERPTTTIIEKDETEEEQKNGPAVTSFDTTFAFNKGYTTNEKELNQVVAYKPEYTEGVIKCESIKSTTSQGVTNKQEVYLYYKDNGVKKIITTADTKYKSSSLYNQYMSAFKTLKSEAVGYDNLIIEYTGNSSSLSTKFNMYVDLVYGNNFRFDNVDSLFYISISYNTPIKSAINKVLTEQSNSGNMKCSTLITN